MKAALYLKTLVKARYERLRQIRDAPRAVAGGVAIGIFWGFTPLLGFKTLLSIFFAWISQTRSARPNEEAAKALLMAAREEQLKGALTRKAVDRRGGRGFSENEFQFLSQDNAAERGALQSGRATSGRATSGELQREKGQAGALNGELPGAIARLNAAGGSCIPAGKDAAVPIERRKGRRWRQWRLDEGAHADELSFFVRRRIQADDRGGA